MDWPAIILWILALSGLIFWLLSVFHRAVQKIKGYKWWYRNVYLWTPHWRFTRKVRLLLSGYQCQKCSKIRLTEQEKHFHSLDVHHRTYRHIWWEWLFFWDLMVLCRYHHSQEHAGKS
jgi:hypothetical protein